LSSDISLDPLSSVQIEKASSRFDNACLLIIDEMSMIDTILLYHISCRLQQITQCNDEFGGIPIILMGDMFQLPPTAGESMYKTVFKKSTPDSWQRPSQQGSRLFKSFKYYELTAQMRSKSEAHSNLIYEMRNSTNFKNVAKELLQHLRVITREDIHDDYSWTNAPIIVSSNYERHNINLHKARAFARDMGVPILTWRKPLVGRLATILNDQTLDLLYENTAELTGIFVQCAPCVLRDENINPTRGLANGTAASLHSITFANTEELVKCENLINKAQPGELISIPVPSSINVEIKFNESDKIDRINAWPNNLTLQPGKDQTSKAVVIPLLQKIAVKGIKFKNTTIDYKDHFIDLSFAMTFHKIQGKTVDKIILDINQRPGTKDRMHPIDFFGLYVGISRIKNSSNLRILPPHHGGYFSHIEHLKCDPDLRRWIQGYKNNQDHWEMIGKDKT
jgi:hypothetical protein